MRDEVRHEAHDDEHTADDSTAACGDVCQRFLLLPDRHVIRGQLVPEEYSRLLERRADDDREDVFLVRNLICLDRPPTGINECRWNHLNEIDEPRSVRPDDVLDSVEWVLNGTRVEQERRSQELADANQSLRKAVTSSKRHVIHAVRCVEKPELAWSELVDVSSRLLLCGSHASPVARGLPSKAPESDVKLSVDSIRVKGTMHSASLFSSWNFPD